MAELNRLKDLRTSKGLSQKQLAQVFKTAQTTISKWEKGERTPDPATLIALADFFRVSVDYLLGRTQTARPLDLYKLHRLRKDHLKTQEEIAAAIGIPAHQYKLIENGSEPPTEDILAALATCFNVPKESLYKTEPANYNPLSVLSNPNILPYEPQRVPILGRIACGKPILEQEDFSGYIEFIGKLKPDFCLVCQGDSMIGARIFDGDIVFIKTQLAVENGEIAAVSINDEVTLKRVYVYENSIELRAENPMHKPIIVRKEDFESIRILGKAIAFQSRIV